MPPNEICDNSATQLAERLRTGDLSAVDVLTAHLGRIEAENPRLNAIVTLCPDRALDAARAADRRRAAGEILGPLHGLPIAYKDLVLTRGVRTTLGSTLLRDFVPENDDLIVERLTAAGAILVGKTNTPEFGAGSQTFNEVFGATRNPWDVSKTCGGSSGGAAVAVASGMLPIADGSDMGGSLRNPASFCGVVGMRTSPGRVPIHPARDAWSTLSVLGPMARSAQDAALLLSAMAGPDPHSPIALPEPGESFARPLGRDFRGVRIAWSEDLGGLPLDQRVRSTGAAGRRIFENLGCLIDEGEPDLRDADAVFKTLRAMAFVSGLAGLDEQSLSRVKDTVRWNYEQGVALRAADLVRAQGMHGQIYLRMQEFLRQREFLVAPVSQVPPFDIETPYPTEIDGVAMETYIDWMKSCYFITVTGHPAASVPCGFTEDGLPVGLQIIGHHRDDFGVLQLAHAFEQARGPLPRPGSHARPAPDREPASS